MATPSKLPPNSTIQVTYRTDRSIGTSLLTNFIKPFGSALVKPPSRPVPAGSPELEIHESVYRSCNVRPRRVADIRVYDVNLRSAATMKYLAGFDGVSKGAMEARNAAYEEPPLDPLHLDPTPSHTGENIRSHDFARTHTGRRSQRHVYYFAGGGWRTPASKEHWKLATQMVIEGSNEMSAEALTVSIVSYPLAPHCPAGMTMPMLERFYYEVLRPVEPSAWRRENGVSEDDEWAPPPPQQEEIWFMGDSSGGNIVLALVLNILRRDAGAPVPHGLFLISPAVDLALDNAEIAKVAKKDPVLTVSQSLDNGKKWCGGDFEVFDPRVSPLRASKEVFELLSRRGVVVNGVNGLYDIHAPDGVLLVRKLAEARIRGRWLEWDRQIHCFPLAFSYGLKEGKEALGWILAILTAPASTST